MIRRLAALVVLLALLAGLAAGCSKDKGSKEAFCAALPRTPDLATLLDDLDSSQPTQVEDRLENGRDKFRALAKAAPDELRDAVDQVADTVDVVLDAVHDNLDDRTALKAELAKHRATILAAGPPAQKIVDYASEECGIELSGS